MLFNSHLFIFLFLPLVIVFHDLLCHKPGWRPAVLLLASLIFYAHWSLGHSVLLILSMLGNYGLGHFLLSLKQKQRPHRHLLVLALCFNFAPLTLFKYTDFVIENLNLAMGLEVSPLGWVLPLGISFYSFQQMSFHLDIYQGQIKQKDLLTFCCYVAFFPQLIAGPIVRYNDVAKGLQQSWGGEEHWSQRCRGFTVFVIGLGKKLWIADPMAPFVDQFHTQLAGGHEPALLEAWLMTLAYPFQLYFDFSGYSDMACGLALMFGLHIPQNFNSPFKAKNISDFWQRWHISLSICFQRYLFNPLAMSLRHHRSLWIKQVLPFMLTMTLIGLWHGSGWTYIIWGGLHGAFLSVAYLWKSSRLSRHFSLQPKCSWALTFLAVMLVFIWFRAENINAALSLYKGLCGIHGMILPALFDLGTEGWLRSSFYLWPCFHEYRTFEPLLAICPAWLIAAWAPNSQQWSQRFKMNKIHLFATSFLLFLCLIKINKVSVFLYYQF